MLVKNGRVKTELVIFFFLLALFFSVVCEGTSTTIPTSISYTLTFTLDGDSTIDSNDGSVKIHSLDLYLLISLDDLKKEQIEQLESYVEQMNRLQKEQDLYVRIITEDGRPFLRFGKTLLVQEEFPMIVEEKQEKPGMPRDRVPLSSLLSDWTRDLNFEEFMELIETIYHIQGFSIYRALQLYLHIEDIIDAPQQEVIFQDGLLGGRDTR